MTENDQQNIICNRCHNAICRESLVTCLRCTKTMKKMCTLKFDMNRYSLLEHNIQEMAKSQKTNSYICKSCHEELQQKLYVCVVTNRCRNMYAKCTTNKTNFSYFVVSQCLQHVSNSVHEDQYISMSCEKGLKQTSDENPVLPYHAKYSNAVTGANFLKSLNETPEYVCICCHSMLFHKTVQQFHMKDYDMSNERVKECLSH